MDSPVGIHNHSIKSKYVESEAKYKVYFPNGKPGEPNEFLTKNLFVRTRGTCLIEIVFE